MQKKSGGQLLGFFARMDNTTLPSFNTNPIITRIFAISQQNICTIILEIIYFELCTYKLQ